MRYPQAALHRVGTMNSCWQHVRSMILLAILMAASPLCAVEDAAPSDQIAQQAAEATLHGAIRSVAIHAEFDVRRFLATGDAAAAQQAVSRLRGIAAAYRDPKAVAKIDKDFGGWFFERYPLYFTYRTLEERKLLPAELAGSGAGNSLPGTPSPEALERLATAERGPNNRTFNFAGDALIAAWKFPNDPRAAAWQAHARAAWQDWLDYGAVPEVMPSYNRLFLAAALDLAEWTGRQDDLRKLKANEFKRYFRQMSGNGVRGGEQEAMASLMGLPNADNKVPGWYGLEDIYSDPWAGTCTLDWVSIALKSSTLFKDPEYLWYARTMLANGDVPDDKLPAAARSAIQIRLAGFLEEGQKLQAPADHAFVEQLDFPSGPLPERVVLMPQRAGTGPFAAFYVYDRLSGFMHGVNGQVGRLYEFSLDGSLLLRQGGKYSGAAAAENTIMMTQPWKSFPTQGPGSVRSGVWTTATVSLLTSRFRWQGDAEYVYDPVAGMPFLMSSNPDPGHRTFGNFNLYNKTGDSTLTSYPLHFGLVPHGPPPHGSDGQKLSTTGTLTGVDIRSDDNPGTEESAVLLLRNLRLVGPKGVLAIDDLARFRDDVRFVYTPPSYDPARFGKKFEPQPLTLDEVRRCIEIIADPETPGAHIWRMTLCPGTLSITFPGLPQRVSLVDDYTRLALDYQYVGDVAKWSRLPIGFGKPAAGGSGDGAMFDESQGAITESAVVDQHDGDVLSTMVFRNVWSAGTRWTRRALLLREGAMLVCDDIEAGPEVDGWSAGPLWHLGPDWKKSKSTEVPLSGSDWYDAPAFNRAAWQTDPKRLLVYLMPAAGRSTGSEQQDTDWYSSYGVWQKGTLRKSARECFVSLLVPHDAAVTAAAIAKSIAITSDERGDIRFSTGPLTGTLSHGVWSVARQQP